MSDEENKTRATTGVKFSAFNQVEPEEGNPIEVVGLRDGDNVRATLTTDLVETNPGQFRGKGGRLAPTPEELDGLTNQKAVNEFLWKYTQEGSEAQDSLAERVAEGESIQESILGRVSEGEDAQKLILQQIQDGLDEQETLQNKVSALEGAVGEHSLVFTLSNETPRTGEFNVKDPANQLVNTLSGAKFIHVSSEDRDGKVINIDRITVGDVMRLSDIGGVTAEVQIKVALGGGLFEIEKLFGELDRLSEYPYDFNLFSSFDPQGLATIDYVDTQDEKKLSKFGDQVTGPLSFSSSGFIDAMVGSSLSGRGCLEIRSHNDRPVAVTSGSSYKELLAFFGYNKEEPDKREKVAYIKANGTGHFKNVTLGAAEEAVATKNYVDEKVSNIDVPDNPITGGKAMQPLAWKYVGNDVEAAKLNDGEFTIRSSGTEGTSGGTYTIYTSRYDILGRTCYARDSGGEYSFNVDNKVPMSIQSPLGGSNIQMLARKLDMGVGPSQYARFEGRYWRVAGSLTKGQYYVLNVPGLLPTWGDPDTARRSLSSDDEGDE